MRDDTFATQPGKLSVSTSKLKIQRSDLFGLSGFFKERKSKRKEGCTEGELIDEHMQKGDCSPAMVIAIDQWLFVAAYTAEIDCVAMLAFPTGFSDRYHVSIGTRLLAVSSYLEDHEVAPDLLPGPEARGRWQNFSPIIAEFLCDDCRLIETQKSEYEENLWNRVETLGKGYREAHPDWWRAGMPLYSIFPCKRAKGSSGQGGE